ncbi:MAG: HAD family phosphatase [Clostridiales bacterium]|nr:HAD family phosphatase [Clostridiales bacterium]
MIKLIVSDIDGTLVPEGGSCLNPEYMDVIRAFTARGVQFAAASGRQASSMDAVFHELRDQIYYLSDNGAYIQKNGEAVREVRMDREDVIGLMEDVRKIPGCHCLLSAKEGYYTDDKDPLFHDLVFRQYKGSGEIVEDVTQYADVCIKISLYSEEGAGSLRDILNARWKDRFAINISGSRWLDINDFDSTKGNAVRWIQEQIGASLEETVVFGDNFNDISMLERSARSYASVLSHPDIKKAARYEVASYQEDGVLQVLKKLLEETKYEK